MSNDLFAQIKKSPLKSFISLLLITSFCLGISIVTKRFDYNWSWERVPSFFISEKIESIYSPSDGTLAKIDNSYYIIPEESSEESSQRIYIEALENSKDYEFQTNIGSYVSESDELAIKKSLIPGLFLKGMWLTIRISFFSSLLALLLGVLCALARISDNPIFTWPSYLYIEIVRGTPLLVQLFIIYFMVGTVFGIDDRFVCGVIALGLFAGAYCAEIMRSGIQSIDKGQMEAARSLGMGYFQSMWHVIFPQMLRRSIASLAGIFISLIKDSSLVSVMALTDLTKAGREIVSTTFMVFEVWIIIALLYLIMTYGTSLLTAQLEKKLSLGEST